jgi:hypothetical protein
MGTGAWSRLSALLLTLIVLTPASSLRAWQEEKQDPPSIAEKTEGMERIDGFIPMYWDAKTGKLWLEIDRFDEEVLHYASLPAGIGSNDIGLDRGQLGPRHVVRFHRVGPQVLMAQPNYDYRASTQNAMERKAVEDAFAQSVLWGFKIEAETDGAVLVDATDFLLQDAHGVIESLRRSNQGTYRLEKSRSALYLPRTRGFPRNTEIEVTLTFVGDRPGGWVRSVTPTPQAITVRQHHSFVELPALGEYTPREHDPRAGFFGISYMDYAAPLGESLTRRFISRHRLEKQNPGARMSDPVEPIVYYLDPGTPEPVRSALLDGARWWNQAFEAAGYRNAFQVEMLPDDADPMDLRYNVIQWVHRSTRGWSYGSSVTDPRTGEILKGHVSLGSLRVRQDYLIAEGLLAPYEEGTETPTEVREMALARIRQLSAHEVGHTLGLAHNYISSAQGRASVMDYPHPLVQLGPDGVPTLSDAYDVDIGEWDKVSITFGYQDFPQGTNEAEALEEIIQDARREGFTFLTDQDARPVGSAHGQVHLWDNGADPALELDRMMTVRRAALSRFDQRVIQAGTPLATMEEALVPLYFHHRYQVEAAAKMVGGMNYTYALRGDGQVPLQPISAGDQRRALESIIATLDPSELAIPEGVLAQLPPRPAGYGPHRELFDRYTGVTFDPVAPAAVASDMVIGLLLHPERAARLVEQHARDPDQPGLTNTINALVEATFGRNFEPGYMAEISRSTEYALMTHLMRLSATAPMPQVRAEATWALNRLSNTLGSVLQRAEAQQRQDPSNQAHYFTAKNEIERFLARPMEGPSTPAGPSTPPGSPIGDPGLSWPDLTCEYGGGSWLGGR